MINKSLLCVVATLALFGDTAFARTRVRREKPSYWWLGANIDAEPSNPTLGALIGPNKPAKLVNSPTTSGLSSLNGLFVSSVPIYEPCECVPYYQCEEGNIVTDGAGIIDIRVGISEDENPGVGRMSTHSNCTNFLDVCCKQPNTAVAPLSKPQHIYQPRCGRLNPTGVIARVSGIGANQAQFAEFPFMAALLQKEQVGDEEVNLYLCGASLVTPNVVLTAAHCVKSFEKTPEKLKVRLGEWDTQRTYEPYSHVDTDVLEVRTHPLFNSYNLHNDFAVLLLEEPVTLSPHIDTICLPKHHEDFEPSSCFVAGWGKDDFGKEGEFQNILKKVSVSYVDHAKCETQLRKTRLGKHFWLDPSFVCAGDEVTGNDACQGDGGSPLVCRHKTDLTRYLQVGIVAWGIGCGNKEIPGVYASITHGQKWIDEQLRDWQIIRVL